MNANIKQYICTKYNFTCMYITSFYMWKLGILNMECNFISLTQYKICDGLGGCVLSESESIGLGGWVSEYTIRGLFLSPPQILD
jgi:hypothetical protein